MPCNDPVLQRQVFFRKKLIQSSHSMRAMSLGQDRYRRRYWLLPHIGGVLVEGPEDILGKSSASFFFQIINIYVYTHTDKCMLHDL